MESQKFLNAVQRDNNSLFNKNLECQKLRSNAETIASSFDLYKNGYLLLKIFYSPLTNSCVFSFTHVNNELGNSTKQYYKLYNLFTSELLISKEAVYNEGVWDKTNELFLEEVKKYE